MASAPLMAVTMGLQAAGTMMSAQSTIAGGNYALQAGQMQKTAADYQASQIEENATQAFASGQRQALDAEQKTRLAISSSTARAAAGGVNAGAGSPATNVGMLAGRGSYQALMDMFNGASTATGLRNQAAGIRYTGQMEEIGGEEAQSASRLAAMGTIAGGAGSMLSTYGKFQYPTLYGRSGVQF